MADTEAAQILPEVSALKRKKVLRALRDVSAIPRKTMDADTRRAATRLLQAASPLRHRMVRNTRELLRRYKLPVPKRDPREVVVEMTPAESALYTAVEDFIGDAYRAASPEKRSAVGFVMTVYRRRLASSFEALKRTLNGRLMRAGGITEEDASQDETSDEVMSGEEVECLVADAPEIEAINERERINDLLRRIAQLGTDSKARRLKVELEACLADGFDSMIVFTQYTDTMEYLRDYLADQMAGMPVACLLRQGRCLARCKRPVGAVLERGNQTQAPGPAGAVAGVYGRRGRRIEPAVRRRAGELRSAVESHEGGAADRTYRPPRPAASGDSSA